MFHAFCYLNSFRHIFPTELPLKFLPILYILKIQKIYYLEACWRNFIFIFFTNISFKSYKLNFILYTNLFPKNLQRILWESVYTLSDKNKKVLESNSFLKGILNVYIYILYYIYIDCIQQIGYKILSSVQLPLSESRILNHSSWFIIYSRLLFSSDVPWSCCIPLSPKGDDPHPFILGKEKKNFLYGIARGLDRQEFS